MSMFVPINVPIIEKEEIKAANQVLKSASLTSSSLKGGRNVQEFENLLSHFVKSKFAVAVNSGTSALLAALYTLNIKKGDEILLPSFTFVATANAVVSTGAKPVFVDVLKDNYTMDPADLQKKITKNSRAIIPVHIYGNVAFMDTILDIAKKNNLKVIEDAAQSLGSTYKKKHTGTFGDMGCYSLYPAKVMTAGEGGVVVTNNKKLYNTLLMIRNHGMVKGYDTRILGLNLRMPEISAAIAKEQIKKLPSFIKKRENNAKILSELIADLNIKIPKQRKDEKLNWYLYTILTSKRNQILKKLNKMGIGAAAYYSTPVHKTPFYKSNLKLTITEKIASQVLSLPIHPKVTIKHIEICAQILKESLK